MLFRSVIKVSLTGTKAIAGDTVQLYNGTGTTSQLGSSYTLTSTDITNGYATVQPGTLLNGSTYNITSRITSTVDGLQSNASSAFTVTIDTVAPTATATVTALSADTGTSGSDFITRTAAQTISGTFTGTLGTGETIQVSADGTTWVNATTSGSTFTASGVTLVSSSSALSVRTIDLAGNVTTGTGHSYTLDTIAPSVSITSETSNNATSTLAKAGDVITVAFTSTDTVTSVTIGGRTATVTNTGGNNYTATYTVQSADNALATTVAVTSTDVAGNTTTQNLAAAVTIDTEIGRAHV